MNIKWAEYLADEKANSSPLGVYVNRKIENPPQCLASGDISNTVILIVFVARLFTFSDCKRRLIITFMNIIEDIFMA